MRGARKYSAKQNPEEARKIAELRGQRRADQRTWTGNGGKVMAQQNPFISRFKIVAVAQTFGRRGARVIQQHDFGGDELCRRSETRG